MPDTPRIEELRRRVQSDPASIAFAALAEEYRRTGRYEEAIEVCRTGLQRHPSYISAHVTLGRALIEVGRYDEARAELDRVLQVAPENLAATRALADIHHRQGQSLQGPGPSASDLVNLPAPPLAPLPPLVEKRPAPIPVPSWTPFAAPGEVADTAPAAGPQVQAAAPAPADVVAEEPPTASEAPCEQEPPAFEAASIAVDDRMDRQEPEPSLPPVPAAIDEEPEPPVTFAPPTSSKADPALEGLEAFLHAIQRARGSSGDVHAS